MIANSLAGTAVRFEPGETKPVSAIDIGGLQLVHGGNNVCSGPVNRSEFNLMALLGSIRERGFLHEEEVQLVQQPSECGKVVSSEYAVMHLL